MKDHELTQLLLTPARLARLKDRADKKLNSLTLVLDRVHDLGNISACIRSSEAFGIMDVHIIVPERFKIHRNIARSTDYWVNIHRHQTPADLLQTLNAQGFEIAAALPLENSRPFAEFKPPPRLALVMGGEGWGVCDEVLAACRHRLTIPMHGFCESLNISTSAAILLQHFSSYYRNNSMQGDMDRTALLNSWIDREIQTKTRGRLQLGDPLTAASPEELQLIQGKS